MASTSILTTIRTMLGVQAAFTGFDVAIMASINSAIFSLSQIGIGPGDGFYISDADDTWADLFDEVSNLEAVKSYIYLKVRLEFDPPGTSFLIQSMEARILELESRLMMEVDPDYVEE